MKRRYFWLCASYRITHDDWVFAWMESETPPSRGGVAVFSGAPMVVYEDEDPAEKIAAIRITKWPAS